MPHCTKCGAVVVDSAAFCGNCGAAQAAQASGSAAPPSAAAHPEMRENVAGALCYALFWITGLIFYFVDKRPYVRFHAEQSIIVFGAITILHEFLRAFFGFSFVTGEWADFSLGFTLWRLLHLGAVILWILLMVKAYQGERLRIPFAADVAEQIFGKL